MSFNITEQSGSLAMARHGAGVYLGPGIDAKVSRVKFMSECWGS